MEEEEEEEGEEKVEEDGEEKVEEEGEEEDGQDLRWASNLVFSLSSSVILCSRLSQFWPDVQNYLGQPTKKYANAFCINI